MPSSNRPVAVDLFAGAGGLSLGLEQAGYDIAASVEYDPIHAAVHHFNFPYGRTFCVDAATITGREIRDGSAIQGREIDLVAGGPPCQGISLMGKRAINDPRNALLKEFVRLVLELNPRHFLMENVAGLTTGGHRQLLDEVVEMFTAAGYRVVTPVRVLQAADFGTPQSRKRLILLGSSEGAPDLEYPSATVRPRLIRGPAPESSPSLPKLGLQLGPSVADALNDLPDADTFDELLLLDVAPAAQLGTPSTYASHLRDPESDSSNYGRPRTNVVAGLTSSLRTVHTANSVARFNETAPGAVEPVSRFLRLHPQGICNTLRAGTGSDRGAYTAPRPIHPMFPRVITVREAARLHGYPDWFRFHATKWNGFREIGNSVPAHLGRAIGAAILRADGIQPTRGDAVSLEDDRLLYLNAGQAHEYFGLSERVIPQRNRTSAGSSEEAAKAS